MTKAIVGRRGLLSAAGLGLATGIVPAVAAGAEHLFPSAPPRRMLSATEFGVVGDGVADDSKALQAALDAAFAPGGEGGFLLIPPGSYRVTRTLRIAPEFGAKGNITLHSGILAHGAHILSAVEQGQNVVEIVSRSTIRFMLIEGLDILGSGREGHGIYVECDRNDNYFYNFCLRDVVVQNCGGDGCLMIGNVFEGQIINSYFRKNRKNGITFSHGFHGGILSSIHVFGCVLGDNGQIGAALVNKCYDVAFHGCYFLLNGKFGLAAENGCTLLSNCGFENNHHSAKGFEDGDAGIHLRRFGALVGCTSYSIYNQTRLIRADLDGYLVMVGCSGSGDNRAKRAGLARLGGEETANATIIGCSGAIEYVGGFEGLEIGGPGGGVRFGSHWKSRNLPRLGEYRIWVDGHGRLRLKNGVPASDDDGALVGA